METTSKAYARVGAGAAVAVGVVEVPPVTGALPVCPIAIPQLISPIIQILPVILIS
jgi:hypothetical protein